MLARGWRRRSAISRSATSHITPLSSSYWWGVFSISRVYRGNHYPRALDSTSVRVIEPKQGCVCSKYMQLKR